MFNLLAIMVIDVQLILILLFALILLACDINFANCGGKYYHITSL